MSESIQPEREAPAGQDRSTAFAVTFELLFHKQEQQLAQKLQLSDGVVARENLFGVLQGVNSKTGAAFSKLDSMGS